MAGEIISERRATSNRNGGRDHPGIPGDFSRNQHLVRPKAHALIVLDQAAWHTTEKLPLPGNLSLLPLPPKSPELNPVENVWQFLRQNTLSNRIFDGYEAIVTAACDAWNSLIADPERIISIGTRSWAATSQS